MDLSWNCVRARGLGGLFKCLLKTGSRRKFDCVQITMPVFNFQPQNRESERDHSNFSVVVAAWPSNLMKNDL